MPETDREVFDRLTGDESVAPALGFISYAMFAHERREWVQHHTLRTGSPPTQAEIDAWTGNLTTSQFDAWTTQAAGFFDNAARDYLAGDIEAARQEVLQTALIREVRAAGSFWKQLAVALLTSILAPVLIGAGIAAVLLFTDRFPSVRDFAKLPPAASTSPQPPSGSLEPRPN